MATTLDDIIKAQALLDEQIRSTSAEVFAHYFAPIFADERIHAIVWGQWAPYFNDGDPCVFGVNYEISIRAKGHTASPYGYDEDDHGLPTVRTESSYRPGCWFNALPPDLDALNRQACEMIEALPLGLLKKITEDGVVIVTREGVTIEDYEHD